MHSQNHKTLFEIDGSLDEWLSQRSAKPCTAVRIRQEPQCYYCVYYSNKTTKHSYGALDEWLSQWSAKPCTAVRICQVPPKLVKEQNENFCSFFFF